jgi:hypothetical protein
LLLTLFRKNPEHLLYARNWHDEFVGEHPDMKSNLPPVLLTSCVIVSDHSVSLKDENSRIRLTIESIEEWLAISPDLRLVICDGSNFDFTRIVLEKFPHANIECLFFQNNSQLVGIYGKGYGEGEIVNYAISNSAFLKESAFFAKCTGKLWVDNFLDCVREWNGTCLCKGYFADVFSFKRTRFEYIDTRFYLVSKSFYSRYFASAYLIVGGERGLSLEHCFRDVILENKLGKILFNVSPVICGVGGGTGTYYKNNLKRRIKEVIRLHIVKRNKSFNSLFA